MNSDQCLKLLLAQEITSDLKFGSEFYWLLDQWWFLAGYLLVPNCWYSHLKRFPRWWIMIFSSLHDLADKLHINLIQIHPLFKSKTKFLLYKLRILNFYKLEKRLNFEVWNTPQSRFNSSRLLSLVWLAIIKQSLLFPFSKLALRDASLSIHCQTVHSPSLLVIIRDL